MRISRVVCMTTNKDPGFIARKMVELVDRQDWVATTELVAPNARAYIGSQIFDREGWRGMGQMFYAAFPDARHEVHAVHVAGEYATLLARFTGTHKGDFMGIPATGKQVSFSVIHVDRVVDGRVLEHRGEFDTAGLLQQLAPAPALDRATVETLFDRIDRSATLSARTPAPSRACRRRARRSSSATSASVASSAARSRRCASRSMRWA